MIYKYDNTQIDNLHTFYLYLVLFTKLKYNYDSRYIIYIFSRTVSIFKLCQLIN